VVVLLMKLEGRREKDVVCLENEEQWRREKGVVVFFIQAVQVLFAHVSHIK
jgi:hypothetical protein